MPHGHRKSDTPSRPKERRIGGRVDVEERQMDREEGGDTKRGNEPLNKPERKRGEIRRLGKI